MLCPTVVATTSMGSPLFFRSQTSMTLSNTYNVHLESMSYSSGTVLFPEICSGDRAPASDSDDVLVRRGIALWNFSTANNQKSSITLPSGLEAERPP